MHELMQKIFDLSYFKDLVVALTIAACGYLVFIIKEIVEKIINLIRLKKAKRLKRIEQEKNRQDTWELLNGIKEFLEIATGKMKLQSNHQCELCTGYENDADFDYCRACGYRPDDKHNEDKIEKHPLTLAVEKARGGPTPPPPMQGF